MEYFEKKKSVFYLFCFDFCIFLSALELKNS